jgi:urease accessory protein
MRIRNHASALAASGAVAVMPLRAEAHHAMDSALPGNLLEGLVSGLAHPIVGFDHFLFVPAIGAACYYFGRKSGTVAAFLAGTIGGTVLHLYKATLPYPDAWVAASLVLLGVLFFRGGAILKTHAALLIFGVSGIVHGYAYGESIVGAEPTPLVAYLAGFTFVQLAVVFAGYAGARYIDRKKPTSHTAGAVGGALSVGGIAFLALSFA